MIDAEDVSYRRPSSLNSLARSGDEGRRAPILLCHRLKIMVSFEEDESAQDMRQDLVSEEGNSCVPCNVLVLLWASS